MRTIYLASGWFTPSQMAVMNKVRNAILQLVEYKLFAPFYDGVVLDKENDSPEMRQIVFELDVMKVINCDLVVVVIDDFDPGAIFEMGLACGFKKGWNAFQTERSIMRVHPWILAYSDVPHRGLNVMLAQSCIGFVNGIEELMNKLRGLDTLIENQEQWRGEFV